nr:hypothetical protein [Spirulina major]
MRSPNPKELAGTLVLSFPLTEASAKMRSGPPIADWVNLETRGSGEEGAIAELSVNAPQTVEAQGWYKDETGKLILTTEAIAATPHSPRIVAGNCSAIAQPQF